MTNEEAYKLIHPEASVEPAPVPESEPTPAPSETEPKPATAATPAEPGKTAPGGGDAVEPKDQQPKAPETKGGESKEPKQPKKNFYSQTRAEHEFAKQTKRLNRLQDENAALKAELEKLKGVTKESFRDKVTGKVDEEAYIEHLADKKAAERRAAEIESQTEELEAEQAESQWNEKVYGELGEEEGDKFTDFCREEVAEGVTRYGAFANWLQQKDKGDTAVSFINSSKKGIAMLKHLMEKEGHDDRLKIANARTMSELADVMRSIEDNLGKEPEAPKPTHKSVAEMWKGREKKQPAKPALTPTGSAFSGQTKAKGEVVKDNNYYYKLLHPNS